MEYQPHLKITTNDISPYVLLPGDPDRVEIIGKYLNDFKIISQNREFKIGLGTYKGIPVTICSTGIGCPSTAIAVEELINAGAQFLIRVGTCGGAWRADITAGSLIIPTASVRDEGTTREYVSAGFPAVADRNVVNSLCSSASEQGFAYFVGINRTHDAFYGNPSSIRRWNNLPIISSEMESAALFVIASLRNVKAGAILAVNADPEISGNNVGNVVAESSAELTKNTVDKAIKVSLEAIVKLGESK